MYFILMMGTKVIGILAQANVQNNCYLQSIAGDKFKTLRQTLKIYATSTVLSHLTRINCSHNQFN